MQNALRDVDGAMNFIIKAQNEHPNRVDIVQRSQGTLPGSQPNPFAQANSAPTTTNNPFGAPSQSAAPAFGQPSQPSSAFGRPSQSTAFGQPSGGTAFGQTTTLGQKPNPFGAPSGSGNTFGQPSKLGGSGTFGQPSSLGQKPSAFGASSPFGSDYNATTAPFSSFATTGSAFSQGSTAVSNPFGAPSHPTAPTPFGAPSQPIASNPFGAPSQQTQAHPFGKPLDQPSNPFGGGSAAPFAAPSQPPNPNPFGNVPSQQQNPFGQPPSAPAPNPFGSPQASMQITNPFGAPSVNNQITNSIGQQSIGSTQPGVNGALGNTGHPPLSSYSSKDHTGHLNMFKGKRVVYQNNVAGVKNANGSWSKIWFPEGAPPFYKDTELEDDAYDEDTKAVYRQLGQVGSFPDGVMPILPPKREWCAWDF